MMKKLAVTVFVLSVAAFGCGSDDGDPAKPDTGVDAKTDTAQKLDTMKTDSPLPGAEVGPEVKTDMAIQVDQGEIDGGAIDAESIDQGTIDAQEIDGGTTTLDGGTTIDVQPAMDGGMTVDAGTTG